MVQPCRDTLPKCQEYRHCSGVEKEQAEGVSSRHFIPSVPQIDRASQHTQYIRVFCWFVCLLNLCATALKAGVFCVSRSDLDTQGLCGSPSAFGLPAVQPSNCPACLPGSELPRPPCSPPKSFGCPVPT